MLRTRLATAAVAVPLLIWLIIWSPGWAFTSILIALTGIGLSEFAWMALPDSWLERMLMIGSGLVLAVTVALRMHELSALCFALLISGGLLFSLLDEDMPGAVVRLGHALLGILYTGFLLPHVVSLRSLEPSGAQWVFFAIGCGMAADTGGYFAGRAYGKTKLFPRVSPNKTVEGAIGGLGGSVLGGLFALTVFGPKGLGVGSAIGFALVLGILAQLGDLIESMLKRVYGAKDSGWIIPGHGGLLDRTDSLVLPFVFTYYLVSGFGL